jgi:hypothetical protein
MFDFLLDLWLSAGHPLFHSWDYLSHFQPQRGISSLSLGSSILPSLDAADLLSDLSRRRDLVALGKAIQIEMSCEARGCPILPDHFTSWQAPEVPSLSMDAPVLRSIFMLQTRGTLLLKRMAVSVTCATPCTVNTRSSLSVAPWVSVSTRMIIAPARSPGSVHEYVITAARTDVLRAIKEIAPTNIAKIGFLIASSRHAASRAMAKLSAIPPAPSRRFIIRQNLAKM